MEVRDISYKTYFRRSSSSSSSFNEVHSWFVTEFKFEIFAFSNYLILKIHFNQELQKNILYFFNKMKLNGDLHPISHSASRAWHSTSRAWHSTSHKLISWIMSGQKQIGDTKGSHQIKANNEGITETFPMTLRTWHQRKI